MTNSHGIAVIGIAGRFPGAVNVAEFWDNLVKGVSTIREIPPERAIGGRLAREPNYVNKSATVDGADQFDAGFFAIYPRQAKDLDPQHRLFLETCWQAMEDAGYIPNAVPGQVGVFAGCHMNTYILARLVADAALRDELAESFPGGNLVTEIANDKDYLATRVAYQLNLRGPAIAVQSACSTSLVAIVQACQSLQLRACDMALAGGVTITFPQYQGYLHTEDSILSPDGTCRAFDANAKGTVFGDGVGAVVLKRYDDAVASGDRIVAIIKGWGVSNDGADKQGYTAPSISGQARAIRAAHECAGISAETISYVEAHGTGTLVGDPIEIEALTTAFRQSTDENQFCAIGSLKTNMGHLDVAAGVAGVIKTALMLHHRQLPPSLNFDSPNPRIDFQSTPFFVNTTLKDWEANESPRRAGVSSFGVGGTNAHLILEEAPQRSHQPSAKPFHLLRWSAKSPGALTQMSKNLATCLANQVSNGEELDLADVAFTLQTGRSSFEHKQFIVVSSCQEAVNALNAGDSRQMNGSSRNSKQTPIVFMFPGQGSQHLRMAQDLYRTEPVFAEHVDRCAELLLPHLGCDPRELIFVTDAHSTQERLDNTAIAQPAIFMISTALAKWWQSLGIQPSAMIGHSVGEFAAAVVSGILSLEDGAMLVATRGRLMQELPAGSMLAVRLPAARLLPLLPNGLEIAAINAPELCVVSGPTESVYELRNAIDSGEFSIDTSCRLLKTSHAFHSRMMDPAVDQFRRFVHSVNFHSPQIPIISTVTATELTSVEAIDPNYWARQIREPVRFSDAMLNLLQRPDLVLLEVGPNQTLSTLAKQHAIQTNSQHVISSLPHATQSASDAKSAFLALGLLWQAGVTIDWCKCYASECRRLVQLPTYPFERTRYWFDVAAASPKTVPESTNSVDHRNLPNDLSDDVVQRIIGEQMRIMTMQIAALKGTQ